MTIREQLRDFIREKGIQLVPVSEKINVSQQTLAAMLDGSRSINVEEYFEICIALGINPDYFYSSNNDHAPCCLSE